MLLQIADPEATQLDLIAARKSLTIQEVAEMFDRLRVFDEQRYEREPLTDRHWEMLYRLQTGRLDRSEIHPASKIK